MVKNGQKCDSCGEIVTFLVPVRVLEEFAWGLEMVTRYYCPDCFTVIMESWEKDDEEKTDKEDKADKEDNGENKKAEGETFIYTFSYTIDGEYSC